MRSIQLFVQGTLAYRFIEPAEVLLQIEAAPSANQLVRSEQLLITPASPITRLDDPLSGERRVVFTARGEVEVRYSATVEVQAVDVELAGAPAPPVRDLPPEVLVYLLPSRYCPVERFQTFVDRQFAAWSGGDKVIAILDWIAANLEYRAGVSDPQSTAADTFVDRAGVCRDFTHLAIAFCRAAKIPARAVSAHAWRLEPPDMHAVAEVFVGGRWRLIDPTGLAPLDGLVRVATGRDAVDIAFMTIFGRAELIAQTFAVTRLSERE